MPRKNQTKSMMASSVETVADVFDCSVKNRAGQGRRSFRSSLGAGLRRVNFFPQRIHDHTASRHRRCGACRLRMRIAAGPARYSRHPFRTEARGLFTCAHHAAACGAGMLQFPALRRAGLRRGAHQAGAAGTRQCADGRGRRNPCPGWQGVGCGSRSFFRAGDGARRVRARYHPDPASRPGSG